jgi:hypothetical protein
MNRSQKALTLVFLVLFAATLVCCPSLEFGQTPYVEFHNGILSTDFDATQLLQLRAEWLALAVFYVALFFIFKSPKR